MPKVGSPKLSKSPVEIMSEGLLWILNHLENVYTKGEQTYTPPVLNTAHCETYEKVLNAWKKALRWRQGLDDVLSVMYAVVISTDQVGDQIFLQVIGEPGNAKTKFCDGLLVSSHCHALEHLTGFHSGWKGDDGEDCSLISRINHKTLITPEGDVIMSSPHFHDIMSQQRRIFDGTSGATYKNRKEDLRYTGLRTPWIIAGTPALLASDQARLGDRFLRVCIDTPDLDEKRAIMRRVGFTALRSVLMTSDGTADSTMDETMGEAYKLTGGYVNHLRANAADLLSQVVIDEEAIIERCMTLAEFTADLRARPDPNLGKEVPPCKEMPTRLTHQYVRLAVCIAAVLNKKTVDNEVLRRVKKVAVDTSRGITLDICRYLFEYEDGLSSGAIAGYINHGDDHTRTVLRFLKNIRVAEQLKPTVKVGAGPQLIKQQPRWYLTKRMRQLYGKVMSFD